MRFYSWTIFRYLGRKFLLSILMAFTAIMTLAFFIDLVEMLRDFGEDGLSFTLIANMALLKLPRLAEQILPFVVLFGGIWTFTRLTRSSELVVARAAGVSVWQFIAPALTVGLALGLVVVTLFNPLSARFSAEYDKLFARYVDGKTSQFAISKSGLWLRQGDASGQSVVHAVSVADSGVRLEDVMVLLYADADRFVSRVDAASAELEPGQWVLTNATVTDSTASSTFHPVYTVPSPLDVRYIEDTFASPETVSFWDLPRFIQLAEDAGFSAQRHRLHWHSILAQPFLLCAMILIAATFSLRLSRLGGIGQLILAGTLAGFGLFFFVDLMKALGLSGGVPIVLAAWAPTGIAMLLGTSLLLHLEDG